MSLLNRSILLGIDGLGGSGKSTIASRLQKRFAHSIVIHLDDFIHPQKVRYQDDFEEWYCYYHLQWRYDYLIRKLLKPIMDNKPVQEAIEIYDKETDSYRTKLFEIPAGTMVIVEGIFLQRPEIRGYFDYCVFVNVSKVERLRRVKKRDYYIGDSEEVAKKYGRRYFPAEQYYMERWKPKELADFVLQA